jgi:hypothetical protein
MIKYYKITQKRPEDPDEDWSEYEPELDADPQRKGNIPDNVLGTVWFEKKLGKTYGTPDGNFIFAFYSARFGTPCFCLGRSIWTDSGRGPHNPFPSYFTARHYPSPSLAIGHSFPWTATMVPHVTFFFRDISIYCSAPRFSSTNGLCQSDLHLKLTESSSSPASRLLCSGSTALEDSPSPFLPSRLGIFSSEIRF